MVLHLSVALQAIYLIFFTTCHSFAFLNGLPVPPVDLNAKQRSELVFHNTAAGPADCVGLASSEDVGGDSGEVPQRVRKMPFLKKNKKLKQHHHLQIV